jgi:Protein of unknown function (DUF2778)
MNTFKQSTGELFGLDGKREGIGYAGHGPGRNNPAMENVRAVGPLPRGKYTAVEMFPDHPHVGKYALHLEPDDETRARILAYGRDPDSFFCHGDSVEHPGFASDGCIIQARNTREFIWNNDRDIEVVQ